MMSCLIKGFTDTDLLNLTSHSTKILQRISLHSFAFTGSTDSWQRVFISGPEFQGHCDFNVRQSDERIVRYKMTNFTCNYPIQKDQTNNWICILQITGFVIVCVCLLGQNTKKTVNGCFSVAGGGAKDLALGKKLRKEEDLFPCHASKTQQKTWQTRDECCPPPPLLPPESRPEWPKGRREVDL